MSASQFSASLWRGALRCLGGTLLVVNLSGCVNFWEEVTSRNFKFANLYTTEEPLVVLRDSSDGYKRAKAIAQLEEPVNHGSPQDQELYMKILTASAKDDNDPLVRLAALRTLANYKDPRAPQVIEAVYLQKLPFTPELNTLVRQQALASLEETSSPQARELLIRVARQPSGAVETNLADRQQTLDERLTAVRGLSKYNQYDSIETLVYLMESEKDIAMKDRAYESLKAATGKNLANDPHVWRELLQNPNSPALVGQEPTFIQRVVGSR